MQLGTWIGSREQPHVRHTHTHTHTSTARQTLFVFRKIQGYNVVRIGLGGFLVTAAGLKAYDLSTNPAGMDVRLLPGTLQIVFVEAETLLGLWLLSGLWQGASWIAAWGGFAFLASISLDLAIHKLPCGCFGSVGTRLQLSAWHSFALDLLAIGALSWWRPRQHDERDSLTRLYSPLRLSYSVVLFVVFLGGNAAAILAANAQLRGANNVIDEVPPIHADPGTRLVYTFTVKNNSAEVQRIISVSHNCTCSKAVLERTELAPGEQTHLCLEADLTGKGGAQLFQSFLRLESGEIWTYSVKTAVVQRVTFDPPHLRFGLIDTGDRRVQTVDVLMHPGSDGELPRILSATPEFDGLTVQYSEEPEHLASESSPARQRLTISLLADSGAGTFSANIVVRYQRGGRAYENSLPVNWNVRTRYEATPSRVFFVSPAQSDNTLRSTIVVRRLDDKPFQVRAVRTTDPHINCTATLNSAAQTQQLAVVIEVGRQGRTIAGEVIVETDEPSQPRLEIPVTVINGQLVP